MMDEQAKKDVDAALQMTPLQKPKLEAFADKRENNEGIGLKIVRIRDNELKMENENCNLSSPLSQSLNKKDASQLCNVCAEADKYQSTHKLIQTKGKQASPIKLLHQKQKNSRSNSDRINNNQQYNYATNQKSNFNFNCNANINQVNDREQICALNESLQKYIQIVEDELRAVQQINNEREEENRLAKQRNLQLSFDLFKLFGFVEGFLHTMTELADSNRIRIAQNSVFLYDMAMTSHSQNHANKQGTNKNETNPSYNYNLSQNQMQQQTQAQMVLQKDNKLQAEIDANTFECQSIQETCAKQLLLFQQCVSVQKCEQLLYQTMLDAGMQVYTQHQQISNQQIQSTPNLNFDNLNSNSKSCLQMEVDSLSEQVRQMNSHQQVLHRTIRKLQNKNDSLQDNVNILTQPDTKIKAQQHNQSANNQQQHLQLNSKIKPQQQNVNLAKDGGLKNTVKKLLSLQSSVSNYEESVSIMGQQIEILKKEICRIKGMKAAWGEAVERNKEALMKRVFNMEEEESSIGKNVAILQEYVRCVEAELRLSDEKCTDLQKEVALNVQKVKAKEEQLEETIHQHQVKIDEMALSVKQAEQSKQETQEQMLQHKEELKKQLQEMEVQFDKQTSKMQALYAKELDEQADENASLKTQLAKQISDLTMEQFEQAVNQHINAAKWDLKLQKQNELNLKKAVEQLSMIIVSAGDGFLGEHSQQMIKTLFADQFIQVVRKYNEKVTALQNHANQLQKERDIIKEQLLNALRTGAMLCQVYLYVSSFVDKRLSTQYLASAVQDKAQTAQFQQGGFKSALSKFRDSLIYQQADVEEILGRFTTLFREHSNPNQPFQCNGFSVILKLQKQLDYVMETNNNIILQYDKSVINNDTYQFKQQEQDELMMFILMQSISLEQMIKHNLEMNEEDQESFEDQISQDTTDNRNK